MLFVIAIAFPAAFNEVVAMLTTTFNPKVESTVLRLISDVVNLVPAPSVEPRVPIQLLNDVVAFDPITPIAPAAICPELEAFANRP